jgi:hypothetical protein
MNSPQSLPEHMDYMLRRTDMLTTLTHQFWLVIGEFRQPEVKAWKPYSARVDIPLSYQWEKTKLTTIAFRPWDGTGDDNTYREGSLIIPPEYKFHDHTTRVYPRAKQTATWEPLLIEAIIPLYFGVLGGTWCIWHNSTLQELGIVWENTIGVIGTMQTWNKPSILLTVDGEWDDRFGDPHAIFAPRKPGGYQVAGFISTNDTSSKIYELLRSQGRRPIQY